VNLREDQAAAAASWLESRRGCVIMPTGTGKTEVALHLIAQCASSTLVVAPVRGAPPPPAPGGPGGPRSAGSKTARRSSSRRRQAPRASAASRRWQRAFR
jgi:hypothetical protein